MTAAAPGAGVASVDPASASAAAGDEEPTGDAGAAAGGGAALCANDAHRHGVPEAGRATVASGEVNSAAAAGSANMALG
jgi:hypothetical protein